MEISDQTPRGSLRALIFELTLMAGAFGLALAVSRALPGRTPAGRPVAADPGRAVMIPNPVEDPEWSRATLERALADGTPVLFGSSELTFSGETKVTQMFPKACGRPIVAIGRAGFQSLPILLTLAEARHALSAQSDVTIILSPGWFAEFGTSSGAFLRYLKPRMLRDLLAQTDLPKIVHDAIARQVRLHRDDLTGLYPDWVMPWLPNLRPRPAPVGLARLAPFAQMPAVGFDWDAAEAQWRKHVATRSTGNTLGLDVDYFERYHGRTYPMNAPKLDPWRIEESDVFALSELLRAYHVRARFVVQPLHRRVYADLTPYDELMAEVKTKLEADGHRWISFFDEPYDLALLEDSVHFSAYGWVRVQREMCR